MISFITPVSQNRYNRIENMLFNLNKYVEDKDYEVIISEMDPKEGFKPGQLRNLGYKKSNIVKDNDIVVFFDVDIRLTDHINFRNLLSVSKHGSFISWRRLTRVTEPMTGQFTVVAEAINAVGTGGCIAMYNSVFIESGGYSNLFCGYGKEDDLFYRRLSRPPRLDRDILHVEHNRDLFLMGCRPEAREHNRNMVVSDPYRNHHFDGFRQTLCVEEENISQNESVSHWKFKEIGVPSSYLYTRELADMRSFLLV